MNNQQKAFGIIFWLHLLIIIFAYSSPFWLDWKIIIIIIVGLQTYYWVRGGCDLTFWELGNDTNTTFVWYYLQKIFPRLNKRKTKFFIRIVLPIFLIITSFTSQVFYNYYPYISF